MTRGERIQFQQRKYAERLAEVAAYKAKQAATETPEQRARRAANDRRCAEWDRRNTM